MKFLEKDLEEIIFTTPQEKLIDKGFYSAPKKFKRQVSIGRYGRADLIGIDYVLDDNNLRVPIISVIELKQDRISVSSFLQAINYYKGVLHYLSIHNPKLMMNARFNLTLIGKTIDNSGSFIYLPELFSSLHTSINFYTYDYKFDGLEFSSHFLYKLQNPGF